MKNPRDEGNRSSRRGSQVADLESVTRVKDSFTETPIFISCFCFIMYFHDSGQMFI